MQWFRFYDSILNSPRVMLLPKDQRWDFVSLCCIANQNEKRGYLPDEQTIVFKARITLQEWEVIKSTFLNNSLLIETEKGLMITGWNEKQYTSDDSTERVNRFRGKNVTTLKQDSNKTVTPPEQSRTEIDTEQKVEQNQTQKIYMFKTNQTEREDLQAISRITGDTWPELKNIPIQKPIDLIIWQAAQVIKRKKGLTISGKPFLQALDIACKNLLTQKWWVDCGGPYWLLGVTNDQYNGQQAEIRIAKYLKQGRDAPAKSVMQNNNFGDGQPFYVEKF